MEDVRTLRDELLVDQASFFVLTPLPGSRDHHAAVEAGLPMDADYNNFDSFRPRCATRSCPAKSGPPPIATRGRPSIRSITCGGRCCARTPTPTGACSSASSGTARR